MVPQANDEIIPPPYSIGAIPPSVEPTIIPSIVNEPFMPPPYLPYLSDSTNDGSGLMGS
jgi:hypothetical protein